MLQLISLALAWLFLLLVAGFFGTVAAATASLHVRDLLERDDADHTTINRWLRWAADIRASVTVWHAIALAATALCTFPLASRLSSASPDYLHSLPYILTPILITLIGFLIPRYLGHAFPETFSIGLLPLLYPWAAATRPLNRVLLACANLPLRLLRPNLPYDAPFAHEPESPLPANLFSNPIEEEEHAMIKSIFEFGDTLVREVMTPRTEMHAVPASSSLDEAIQISQESGHSRLPVYEGDLDHIVGVLYVRDVLAYWPCRHTSPPALTEIMRAPFFVPETKKVNELLREFRQLKTQLAVIVDEYGGTSGLVTLEDLIEEIVGDLSDEYDREPNTGIRELDNNTFVVDGSISVYDLNDALDIHIPVAPDFDTVGGYIMSKLGRVPTPGEQISEHDFTLTVLSVNERRVEQVKVARRPPGQPSAPAPST